MVAPNGMRQSDFRRMVVISAVLHVGALGLAVAAPERRAAIAPLPVISVDLVTLPSAKPEAPAEDEAPKKTPAPDKPAADKPAADKPAPAGGKPEEAE